MEMRHQKLSRGVAEGKRASAGLGESGSRVFRPALTTGALFCTRTWNGDGFGCAGAAASALGCAGDGARLGLAGAAGFAASAGGLVSADVRVSGTDLVPGSDLDPGRDLVSGSALVSACVWGAGVLVAGRRSAGRVTAARCVGRRKRSWYGFQSRYTRTSSRMMMESQKRCLPDTAILRSGKATMTQYNSGTSRTGSSEQAGRRLDLQGPGLTTLHSSEFNGLSVARNRWTDS